MDISSSVQKVIIRCTDNVNKVEAIIDQYKHKQFMTVIMANQKIKLTYNPDFGQVYVGNAYGLEFTAKDSDIIDEG